VQYVPFTGAISGFAGGFVGGMVTVFGISVANRRFRRVQDVLPVIVAATILGGLVEAVFINPHWGTSLLFLAWQTAVIVLIAKALAASTESA
jgi:hypothetical protein